MSAADTRGATIQHFIVDLSRLYTFMSFLAPKPVYKTIARLSWRTRHTGFGGVFTAVGMPASCIPLLIVGVPTAGSNTPLRILGVLIVCRRGSCANTSVIFFIGISPGKERKTSFSFFSLKDLTATLRFWDFRDDPFLFGME